MRKSALILAAFALAACSPRETESHGEVVDTTIDNSKVVLDLDSTRDTVSLPPGTDTGVIVKKPAVTGRKPVDMKDSTRRP